MIANKNQLKKALKERKDSIKFMTLVNEVREDRAVGIIRNAGTKQQTNAFTIETEKEDGTIVDSYTWYDMVDIKDNIIQFKKAPITIKILEV